MTITSQVAHLAPEGSAHAWRWARETRVLLGRDEYGREHQTEGDDT